MRCNKSTRISKQATWFILFAIAVVLAAPSTAYADGISLLVAGENANGVGGNGPGSATCDECLIDSLTGMPEDIFSVVKVAYDGVISSSVTGNGNAGGGFGSAGYGFLDYYFEVVGSASGVTAVPVLVNYTLLTDATHSGGPGSAGVSATLQVGTMQPVSACASEPLTPGSNCGLQTDNLIDQTLTYYASPGSAVLIQMMINGSAFNGTWAGTADPSLEIDPSFADAADFSLEVSPIPPGSSIPEPSYASFVGTVLVALLTAGIGKSLRTKLHLRRPKTSQ